MVTLHSDEYSIDVGLVRRLLADQMPHWSGLRLTLLESSGTANVVYRLGDDMVVRMPRSPEFANGPLREAECLPRFSGLPLQVPSYLALGRPNREYPSHWSVMRWIKGTTANKATLDDLNSTASALGEFVLALQEIPTEGTPRGGSYRGRGLLNVDSDLRQWVDQLPDDLDRTALIDIWESCLEVDPSQESRRWLHSDLRGDNLIARGGQLVGVIDWEGSTVGDPSADYLAAWWLFDQDSRETFRKASRAGRSDWIRAMGWGLHMAVAAIPYYADTNPDFVSQARGALAAIIRDVKEY